MCHVIVLNFMFLLHFIVFGVLLKSIYYIFPQLRPDISLLSSGLLLGWIKFHFWTISTTHFTLFGSTPRVKNPPLLLEPPL